ncbi:MAG: 30S ribosomal protein S12 methylthiotransferase RimO [Lentisphaeria bacterium]
MKTENPAVYIVSLGCAKNLVDTEVMCGTLAVDGYLLTDDLEQADIVLINTCSFIADARDEAEAEIMAALEWKKQKQGRYIAVAGCLPQRDIDSVRQRYSDVDLFLGLDDVPEVGRRLREIHNTAEARCGDIAIGEAEYVYDHKTPRLQLTPENYAYIKIAEGCNHFCRFCAIPAIRGRLRSRSNASIKAELQNLVSQGVKEINLIAQDTTAYGTDRSDNASLTGLLRSLNDVEGEFWVRILYTHPRYFTEEVLEAMAGDSRILPYIDMPLQHISDKILQAMGRQTSGGEVRKMLALMRHKLPEAVLRTTFLVGYPGETETDYRELLDFVKQTRFDRLGVFAFSPEQGTAAAGITEDIVPSEVAEARRAEILTVQQDIALAKNQKLVGSKLRILVETADDSGYGVGRTAADAPEVDNHVHFSFDRGDPVKDGFVNVEINHAEPYDLYGYII